MKKLSMAILATVLVTAANIRADNVRSAMYFYDVVDIINEFRLSGTQVTASAAEINLLDGVTATTAEINAAADASARMTTATVTNGAALTLSASTPYVVLTSSGGAADTTNTITIATPYPVGVEFTLINSGASTNLVLIADSTTVLALGADAELGPTDSLKIFTTATNAASKVSNVCNN